MAKNQMIIKGAVVVTGASRDKGKLQGIPSGIGRKKGG